MAKEEMRFWEAELRNDEGFLALPGNSKIDQNVTIEDMQAFQQEIIDRHKKGEKTFIDFSAGYYVDDDFIEDLKTVVQPMQNAERVRFYFLSFIGAQSHKGIIKDDLKTEEELQQ